MAEPETPTPTPAAPTPAAPPPEAPTPEDARVEHATAFVEKALERAGAPKAEEAPKEAAPAAPAPAQAPVAAPARPTPHPATEKWRARRESLRETAERQTLERVQAALERMEQGQGAPPAAPALAAGEEDPEPQPDAYRDDWSYQQAWIGWNTRQANRQITKAWEEKFGPVAEYVKRAEETEQQFRERQQRQALIHEELSTRQRMMVEGEEDYLATPEGEGYYDRFLLRFGHQGAPEHGVPPIDGTVTRGLMRAGIPADTARQMNWLAVQAYGEMALKFNINPAVLVDAMLREELDSVLHFLGRAPGGNGNGAEPAPAPAAPAVHPEMRRIRAGAAAAAGGPAGSAGDGGGGRPATASVEGAIKTNSLDAIKQAVAERYKHLTPAQRAAALRQVAHGLR